MSQDHPLRGIAAAAAQMAADRPEIFQKMAAEFLASQFPNMAAAFEAYRVSKERQELLEAQRQAAAFPALHATQPAMAMMNQQYYRQYYG